MSGWNVLACEDMVMPMTSNGVTDMFHPMTCIYLLLNFYFNKYYLINFGILYIYNINNTSIFF